MKIILRKVLFVLISIIVSLLIAEGLSRVFFDPIDFLKPKRVPDEALRYRIEPLTGAHDALGFRNRSVPDSADIVAIGDSHTYGISATASGSWPSQLASMTGDTVYNISLGGYGPAEYLYLMEKYAFDFHPKVIVAGFYLGNDLRDSFRAVYEVPVWKELRKPGFNSGEPDEEDDGDDDTDFSIGEFLSGHSVLYRLISFSFVGDNLRQMRRLNRGEEIVMFEDEKNGINTGFTPDQRLKGLDLDDPEVEEGLDLSLEFFSRMNELAEKNDTRFIVVIIPTKEMVFSSYIEGNTDLLASEKIDRLIRSEREVDRITRDYFTEHGIEYIDVLEPLQAKTDKEQLYPNNYGGHTNENGYRIIAESIKNVLQ